ncbi:MAG: DUF3177 family protein [Coleofasciculaceae cyanobacterium SM2_3_26]|nr:DUF3177 family protein [Coleofasciculaceae cyanobacterium SM2_3_26]
MQIATIFDAAWLRPLVWADYRLAVLFSIVLPLVLIAWAFVQKAEAMQRLLIIYWRVSSLLAIAVYLLIDALPIGLLVGWVARILILISLWFWVDVNEEIEDRPISPLKWCLTSWRWSATVYHLLGAIAFLPFLPCGFLNRGELLEAPTCTVWLEAPWAFKDIVHRDNSPQVLGFFGLVGLLVYVLYLSYFLLVQLAKQGRSAMNQ